MERRLVRYKWHLRIDFLLEKCYKVGLVPPSLIPIVPATERV